MDKNAMPGRVSHYHIIDLPDGTGIKYCNHLHTLNPTAYEIFMLCDGKRTVQDIFRVMQGRYPGFDIAQYVESFLHTLCSVGLVRECDEYNLEHGIR